ncbi:unnamed protein product, partial [Brassica oleracea]
MSGRRHGNTNPVGQRNSNVHNETSSRNASRFKWTYEQEKTLIELYDQASSMNDYTLKDPTVLGREHMVDNFDRAFNLNINYAFFKNKLDDFKKAYKKWKFLMTSTEITVNPETSMIYASDEWWEARESGCKLTRSFKRKPPPFWDVMTMMVMTYLNIIFLKPKKMKKYIVLTSMPIHFLRTNILKIQLGFLLEEVRNVQDVEVVQKELEDVGALLKHLLETQELMLEVLQEVIEEDNHSRLQYKTPLMDIKNFNDKVYNSYAQNYVPKQLGSGQLFGSPHSGGLSSGSPSSVGNCSRGNNFQNLGAPPTTQQWGTPPNVQHWGTPPNMQHWGTPPNVQYWGTSPNAQPWGVPPNGPSWNAPPNAQQWSTPPYPQQWNIPQNFHHGQQPSNVQQTGSSGTTPTNVHYGFTVGNQGGSPLNTQRNYSEVSVSLIILNQETHHKDRDVEAYSIFGELQKNLMKRIKVVQEMK